MREHRQITKVRQQIKKYLPVGSRVVVACSGGADSLALADALLQLREEAGYRLTVCHVEHGMRGAEALADADFVAAFCEARQVDCKVVRVEVKKFAASNGLSLEDAARKLRYQALLQCAREQQADFLVTGHHRDDQAETVLLHLVRGSGSSGLSAMRTVKGCLLRPFLELSRQELEHYCQIRGLAYRSDSSNEDLYFTRNKVRHLLLPLLEREFNPNIRGGLARTAAVLAEDADCLELLAEQNFVDGVQACNGAYSCKAVWLLALPPALAARVVRKMWQRLETAGLLTYELTQQILELVRRGSSNKKLMLPGNTYAAYSYGTLLLAATLPPDEPAAVPYSCSVDLAELQAAERIKLPLPCGELTLAYVRSENKPHAQAVYPWRLLKAATLELRYRQDGDRFFPLDSGGSKKLKKYFNDQKIATEARDKQLLAVCGQQVLWLLGGRPAGWHEQCGEAEWLTLELNL